jgi:hypothetical protein
MSIVNEGDVCLKVLQFGSAGPARLDMLSSRPHSGSRKLAVKIIQQLLAVEMVSHGQLV